VVSRYCKQKQTEVEFGIVEEKRMQGHGLVGKYFKWCIVSVEKRIIANANEEAEVTAGFYLD
jgi:hypothetical protein